MIFLTGTSILPVTVSLISSKGYSQDLSPQINHVLKKDTHPDATLETNAHVNVQQRPLSPESACFLPMNWVTVNNFLLSYLRLKAERNSAKTKCCALNKMKQKDVFTARLSTCELGNSRLWERWAPRSQTEEFL